MSRRVVVVLMVEDDYNAGTLEINLEDIPEVMEVEAFLPAKVLEDEMKRRR